MNCCVTSEEGGDNKAARFPWYNMQTHYVSTNKGNLIFFCKYRYSETGYLEDALGVLSTEVRKNIKIKSTAPPPLLIKT